MLSNSFRNDVEHENRRRYRLAYMARVKIHVVQRWCASLNLIHSFYFVLRFLSKDMCLYYVVFCKMDKKKSNILNIKFCFKLGSTVTKTQEIWIVIKSSISLVGWTSGWWREISKTMDKYFAKIHRGSRRSTHLCILSKNNSQEHLSLFASTDLKNSAS